MLKITIECWPRGKQQDAYVVGEGFIANDGSSVDDAVGHYDAAFAYNREPPVTTRLEGFRRGQSAWQLLHDCLCVALGGIAGERAAHP